MSQTESGYKGNPLLKRADIDTSYSIDHAIEIEKCRADPVYFAKTYIKIIHVDRGLVPLALYDYQEDIINSAADNRNTIICTARQAGKTTSIVAFVIWYVLFNQNPKKIAILANKAATAREILNRIQLAYTHLPKWLQRGVKEWNKSTVRFDNESMIMADATSSSAIRGYSFSAVVIDEAAHIEGWDEFYTSVYPTISSGKETKMIQISTPNGLNHFWKTWKNSEENLNDFFRIQVMWFDVPGRDEEWRKKTLSDLNYDDDKFEQEYCCGWLGSSGTLIAGWKLKQLKFSVPILEQDGISQYFKPEKDSSYVAICDVSEGKGLDYSTIQIIDVTSMPYSQVCTFKSNQITPADFAHRIYQLGKLYNNAGVLIEINSIGETVAYILHNELEYPNILRTESAGRVGKRITHRTGKNIDNGIKTTTLSKATGCSLLKLIIESNQLIIQDFSTIEELSRFSKKNNSYEAEAGCHDDMVMPLVNFAWLTDQKYFKEYTDINTVSAIREQQDDEINQQLVNFGFIDTGIAEVNSQDIKNNNELLNWLLNTKDNDLSTDLSYMQGITSEDDLKMLLGY